jgi:hypothetical protein
MPVEAGNKGRRLPVFALGIADRCHRRAVVLIEQCQQILIRADLESDIRQGGLGQRSVGKLLTPLVHSKSKQHGQDDREDLDQKLLDR